MMPSCQTTIISRQHSPVESVDSRLTIKNTLENILHPVLGKDFIRIIHLTPALIAQPLRLHKRLPFLVNAGRDLIRAANTTVL